MVYSIHFYERWLPCYLLVTVLGLLRLVILFRWPIKGVARAVVVQLTILRFGILAVVGVSRTVTFCFLVSSRTPDSAARIADSCAYTIECAFPIIL